jgi:antitoxin component of MazEF toxin-antitoxin module
MNALTAGLPTKSAKIRRLAEAGYERAEIARYLGVRYQFVYNVLSAPEPKAKGPRGEPSGRNAAAPNEDVCEPAAEGLAHSANWVWAAVRKGGSIEVPAPFLRAIGAQEGEQVQIALEGDVLRILGRAAAIRELREQVRRYVPEGVSLVEQLLSERRAEAAREGRDGTDA